MENPGLNQAESAKPVRLIVPATQVRLSDEHAPVRIPGDGPAAEARVEVVRDGDIVQALDVYCTCGRHLRLRCVYE